MRIARPPERLSQAEFVSLMAMLFATIAFSIDSMLPALPEIAAELSPGAPNQAQLIVTSFVLGMGLGTLVSGPLSDRFGRKPVILAGAALYILGSALAWAAGSLELVVAARVLAGFGAAGPRVVTLAIVRDLYEGRAMARIMSFVLLVFTLVPAIAPTMGAALIALGDWRTIFLAFVVFSLAGALWLALRQAETLPPERRRPFRPAALAAGVREIATHPLVARAIAVQALCFGMLFATLSSTQPVFDVTFGLGAQFHLWFGLVAVLAAPAALVNAVLVERLGMRAIVSFVLCGQIAATATAAALWYSGLLPPDAAFWVYFVWTVGVFFQAGLTIGNIAALAMEPLGHLAGLGASVIGSVATVAAVLIAVPLGLAFDGTPGPLMLGTLALALAARGTMEGLKRVEARGALGS